MREKQDYRNNLEAIKEKFPGKCALTVGEVAEYLSIRRQTATKLIESGRLPGANVGIGKNKCYRVSIETLARFSS